MYVNTHQCESFASYKKTHINVKQYQEFIRNIERAVVESVRQTGNGCNNVVAGNVQITHHRVEDVNGVLFRWVTGIVEFNFGSKFRFEQRLSKGVSAIVEWIPLIVRDVISAIHTKDHCFGFRNFLQNPKFHASIETFNAHIDNALTKFYHHSRETQPNRYPTFITRAFYTDSAQPIRVIQGVIDFGESLVYSFTHTKHCTTNYFVKWEQITRTQMTTLLSQSNITRDNTNQSNDPKVEETNMTIDVSSEFQNALRTISNELRGMELAKANKLENWNILSDIADLTRNVTNDIDRDVFAKLATVVQGMLSYHIFWSDNIKSAYFWMNVPYISNISERIFIERAIQIVAMDLPTETIDLEYMSQPFKVPMWANYLAATNTHTVWAFKDMPEYDINSNLITNDGRICSNQCQSVGTIKTKYSTIHIASNTIIDRSISIASIPPTIDSEALSPSPELLFTELQSFGSLVQ